MIKHLRATLALTTAISTLPLVASAAHAQALPTGPSQPGSPATITTSGPDMTISLNQSRQIINWTSFDIGATNSVNFVNGSTSSSTPAAVLNRVIGPGFSAIDGSLTSAPNIEVYVSNPNGILFGAGASVDVGGLIATTLGIADADFMDGSDYYFSGSGTTGVIVQPGAEITTTGSSSPLILLGGFVDSSGNLNSASDIVVAAGSDISVAFGAGSPLSMTINQGTPVSTGVVLDGQVNGTNIYLAVASRAGLVNAMLNVDAWLTATTASATDRGIVLAAGTSASGITIASGGSNDTGGSGSIYLDGLLSADEGSAAGNVANVEIRARDRITNWTIQASDAIHMSSNNEHIIAGRITAGGNVNIFASGTIFTKTLISSDAGDISLSASAIESQRDMWGTWNADILLTAGGDINLSGTARARDIGLAAGGAVTTESLMALDDIVIRAGGTADLGSLTSRAAFGPPPADIFTGADGIAGGTLSGQDIDIAANGLSFASATANGAGSDVRFDGGAADLVIGATTSIVGTEVVLSTDQAFINNRGADAIVASDRWLVYSAAPADNVFGGLDSGNTALWNGTIDSVAPSSASGDRYIFAHQPTLTVTTGSATKVYGTDLSGSASGLYAISGFDPGVDGAFLGDAAASAFSGAPDVSSSGFAERASVAGGPYAVSASAGTLASSSGYAFSFDNAGTITVTPLGITGSIAADDKTYDGTPTGSGSVALTGVLAGDSVGASGGSFTFADKSAGTGKTVTVAGVTLTGTDAGNYTLTLPASAVADILQRAITGTASVDDKTYDGTTTGSGSVALTGVIAGDEVGASGGSFTFVDKNVGADKTVTVGGVTLSGADAGNYTLTLPASAVADILQRAITGTVSIDDKVYDGTTAGSGSVTLAGVIAGDSVGASGGTFTFADKNAGTVKMVTVGGVTLSGADAGNYTLTLPASALADIMQRAITGTVSADDKVYDGTITGSGEVSLTGVLAGDDVGASGGSFTFADENAGADKVVTVDGVTLSGAGSGNYTLTLPASAMADILQRAITGTVSVDNKTYDGTTTSSGSIALTGVVAGDNVGASGGSFTFDDKNAGTGKTVTVGGATLTGTDAGNYTLTLPASAVADILQRAITGAAIADDKIYDGTTAGTGTVTLAGIIAGDQVGASGGSFTFADKNAGIGKTVTVGGVTLTGTDAGNYTLTLSASALADILQRAITGTVSIDDKIYDGTTTGSGSVALTGVIVGDYVSATGGTYIFDGSDAGVDRVVTVEGVTLSGNDAGNYTVTVPATAVADILRRAVTIGVENITIRVGQADPELVPTVVAGSMVLGDTIAGSAEREQGTVPGQYALLPGTLSVSSNYDATFEAGTLTIIPGDSNIDPLRSVALPAQIYNPTSRTQPTVSVDPSVFCREGQVCPSP